MMLELLQGELRDGGIGCEILDLADQRWLTDISGAATVVEVEGGLQVRLHGHDLGIYGLYPSAVLLTEMLRKHERWGQR